MSTSARTTLGTLLRKWFLLIAVAAIGATAGYFVSATRPTKYAASAYLLGHATGEHAADSSLVSSSAKVYARAASDPDIVATALRNGQLAMSPESAAGSLNAIASPDTPLLEIRATTGHAGDSVTLANAVASAVESYSVSLAQGTGYEMQHFRSATRPSSPVGPGAVVFAFGGGLLGLLLVVVIIVVLGETRDVRAEEEDDETGGTRSDAARIPRAVSG
jgi:capsular polysaccharide biosynthesis protein